MIVTLAGHVDHGKTSLVRMLTGVDTDRLDEEKRRGLTIDLGFAYMDDGRIGFVDVPGHHKFIHNMVAGIAADQTALLVIAADDGPMPQSREHLDILRLLGLKRGMIALTKCDRVDAERTAQCEAEIRNLVADSFLAEAPMFKTSIEDTASTQPLLEHLRTLADSDASQTPRPFRLAVDRRFNVKGSGLVVTGTVHAGEVSEEDRLFHFPSGSEVRVRGLRAQDQVVQTARQSDRCAINISGLDLDQVERGDWFSKSVPRPAMEFTLDLAVLENFPRPLRHWTPVHIYHATSHARGHIALLDEFRLQPGETARVDVVLDAPLAVYHGDSVVIRDHGLDTTLGGGKVIYASREPTQRRRSPHRRSLLDAFAHSTPEACLQTVLASQTSVSLTDFAELWQISEEDAKAMATAQQGLVINDIIIARAELGRLAKSALDTLTEHTRANPDSTGLKANAFPDLPEGLAQQVLGALVQTGKLQVEQGEYSLAGHAASLPEALQASYEKLRKALDDTQPPSTGDLSKAWRTPQKDIEADLKELGKRGLVTFVAEHRYFMPDRLQELATLARNMAANGPFTVREFRDKSGMGRNVAIEVLEYFDRRGFTRRQDNHRVVLKDTL